jgi:hypothetical protein
MGEAAGKGPHGVSAGTGSSELVLEGAGLFEQLGRFADEYFLLSGNNGREGCARAAGQ